jgi:hypothetical protein
MSGGLHVRRARKQANRTIDSLEQNLPGIKPSARFLLRKPPAAERCWDERPAGSRR